MLETYAPNWQFGGHKTCGCDDVMRFSGEVQWK